MKNIVLMAIVVIVTFGTIGESRADVISCINGKYADGTACNKCGENCNWSFDTESRKLSVSGSGNMYDYTYKYMDNYGRWLYADSSDNVTPWFNYNVVSIDIDGVNTIGQGAFSYMNNVEKVNINSPVTAIHADAFWGTHSLNSVILSDSVTSIFQGSLNGNNLSYIVLPDTIKTMEGNALGRNLETLNNLEIVCLGGKQSCEQLKLKLQTYLYYDTSDGKWKNKNLYDNVSVANELQCVGGNYFWNGAECVREPDVNKRKCCADVCKDMGGWCNRIRYTPAEAAAVMNGDDNTVILTFKK